MNFFLSFRYSFRYNLHIIRVDRVRDVRAQSFAPVYGRLFRKISSSSSSFFSFFPNTIWYLRAFPMCIKFSTHFSSEHQRPQGIERKFFNSFPCKFCLHRLPSQKVFVSHENGQTRYTGSSWYHIKLEENKRPPNHFSWSE